MIPKALPIAEGRKAYADKVESDPDYIRQCRTGEIRRLTKVAFMLGYIHGALRDGAT